MKEQLVRGQVTTSILYHNSLILCVCLSVPPDFSRMGGCVATLLAPSLRVLPGELHKLLSSLHNARFQRKSLCKFSASYAPNPVHTPLHFQSPCVE